jgi:hypothetical protein
MLFGKGVKRLDRSVIAFTTHKAGSMLLHRVLSDICDEHRIRYYSPNRAGREALPFDRMFEGTDFIGKRNGCFGPIRFFVPTKSIDTANVVLHLRDPRDVLTSMFFSYCFIHAGEIEVNTGYRKEVAEAGIDKFVLDMIDANFDSYRGDYGIGSRYKKHIGNVFDRYDRYVSELLGRPNVVLLSYEEMVLDFASWLRKLLPAFELPSEERTLQLLIGKYAATVEPKSEDIWSHRRKVTPGDYKEKLQPATVARLNERFGGVLASLGYSTRRYATTGIPGPD